MQDGLSLLLDALADRGLSVRVKHDGTPYLSGPPAEVTPALKEMMALWRSELIEGVARDPEKPTGPRLREWRWPSGRTQEEDETFCSVGDAAQHPGNAVWWRFVGDPAWQVIPGREGLVGAKPRPAHVFDDARGEFA